MTLDPAKLHRFSDLMISTLCGGETAALRDYRRAVTNHIVVGNHPIRIIGSKEKLARAVAGEPPSANVRSLNRDGVLYGMKTRTYTIFLLSINSERARKVDDELSHCAAASHRLGIKLRISPATVP